jgi:alpha-L-rhamnosidase
MNSFNHWAFGAVGDWLWRHIAGLNPDDAHPGWKHFVIAPHPGGGVTWARADYQSIRGQVGSHWQLQDGRLTLRATVPPNTTATIRLPTSNASGITEGGRPVRPAQVTPSGAIFEVGSGTYEFASPYTTR